MSRANFSKMTRSAPAKGTKMKKIPEGKKGKGLRQLPKSVRNKMGFMKTGGAVTMVQGRGCGAMMDSKRKKTRVPRS